jgi:hypothetical protein
MRTSLVSIVAAASVALFAAAPSWADNPGKHPAYLHALSDLRDARAHLEHFGGDPVVHEQENAIVRIDKALAEIKHAAIMDGKDIQDHVPVDAHMPRDGRLHKAMELLDKAKQDVMGEEDQPDTQGLQMRVLHHIDEARQFVKYAIETVRDHH